ncbi:MAG: energy transducer TonB [Deltaproteobacteria bacterium]|nr:energy transducer TonB [Deltaproteobacteria bacterium]
MRTIRLLAIAVAMLVPAAALSSEPKSDKKDAKIEVEKPNLPDFKLDSGSGAKPASQSGAGAAIADPSAKPKRELDTSKMVFDQESIRQVVKFHMPEIQECYEKVLADTGAKLEGRVVVGFIISAEGNVSEARVLAKKSSLKDDRVHDCVLAMRAWGFPKPNDNRDHPIEYPFDLKVKQ